MIKQQGDGYISTPNETILLTIKFRVRGNLRFLSHAETIKVLQRACVRAGIKTAYSQGFNPHPKLSLPLPRPVGVESDEDLLSLRVYTGTGPEIEAGLSAQLPQGCELLLVSVEKAKVSFRPYLVTYVLAVRNKYLNKELKTRIENLLASRSICVERQPKTEKSVSYSHKHKHNFKSKNVDVRPYLNKIELGGCCLPFYQTFRSTCLIVECKISSAGSIRVDEILGLLKLDEQKLAAPVRRTRIQWQVSES